MDPITLRFAERIVAVLFGGMAIYLGYRLFLEVPEYRGGDGRFALPWDISIVLTRVGPGVFFALFGTAVVATSLFKGIQWQHFVDTPDGRVEVLYGAGAGPKAAERDPRADGRAMLRREIAVLNNLTTSLRTNLPEQDRSAIELAIPRIKLALMKPVWGDRSEGWGDVAEFEHWLKSFEPDPVPASLKNPIELYRYGRSGKP